MRSHRPKNVAMALALYGCGDRRRARSFDKCAHAQSQIVLSDVERRDEAHDLVVEAARDEQHVSLERARDRGLGALGLIELDRDHRAEASYLAHVWVGDQRRELARHEITEALGARDEPVVADDLERREARSARHRVAAERGTVGAGEPALLQLTWRDDRAKRQATTEGLREHEDVGRHADLLRREPRTRSSEARLHLIEDEERADTRCELAQRTQERDGRR